MIWGGQGERWDRKWINGVDCAEVSNKGGFGGVFLGVERRSSSEGGRLRKGGRHRGVGLAA